MVYGAEMKNKYRYKVWQKLVLRQKLKIGTDARSGINLNSGTQTDLKRTLRYNCHTFSLELKIYII